MIRTSSITIIRPANTTAYSAGQRIFTGASGVTSPGSVFANLGETMFGNGILLKASIYTNSTNVATATTTLRLHLYTLSGGQTLATGVVGADQSAVALDFADSSKYVGYVDFSSWVTGTNYAFSVTTINLPFQRASIRGETDFTGYGTFPNQIRVGTFVGILETRTVFTPIGSQQFRVELTANSAEGMLTSST